VSQYFPVRLSCCHTMVVAKATEPERGCAQCEPDVHKRQRTKLTVVEVLIDGEWISHRRFREMRRVAAKHDLNVGKKARRQVQRASDSRGARLTSIDREVIDWLLAAPLGRVVDVVQYLWAKGYFPDMPHTQALLARVELVNLERAEMVRALLRTAENGIVPDKAWYAQYGARAISQEVYGRPTAFSDG
jgi:hypothetical protein